MTIHRHREDELDGAQHFPNKLNDNNQTACVLYVCTYADLCKFVF